MPAGDTVMSMAPLGVRQEFWAVMTASMAVMVVLEVTFTVPTAVQLAASVTVTEYAPGAVIVICEADDPVLHTKLT